MEDEGERIMITKKESVTPKAICYGWPAPTENEFGKVDPILPGWQFAILVQRTEQVRCVTGESKVTIRVSTDK